MYAISIRHFFRQIHPLSAFGVVSQFVSIGTIAAMFVMGRPTDALHLPVKSGWSSLHRPCWASPWDIIFCTPRSGI